MKTSTRFITCVVVAGLVLAAAGRAAAEDTLAAARDLYTAAAYEDALVVLNRLRPSADAADAGRTIQQYRAFCLLALGRGSEAEHAIEAVVLSAPLFRPSDSDASPRIRTAFSDVRRRLLPMIIQQRYTQAKQAFDGKDYAGAAEGFRQVLDLASDADIRAAASQPPLSDLRTLAAGFKDLSAGHAAPPPPAPLPASNVAAAPSVPMARVPATPPASVNARVYSSDDGNVVPPTVVRQTLPPFPLKTMGGKQGVIAVLVGENGSVEGATMLGSISPVYDRMVLEAAKQWKYKAASVDGVPVKFRRVVQINVSVDR
jgi:TonB family protein